MYFISIASNFHENEQLSQKFGGTTLCSKIYLSNRAKYAKTYFIKLAVKFNLKEILFYASSLKNASFHDYLPNF